MALGFKLFKRQQRPPLEKVKDVDFGESPEYLHEYLERVEKDVGRPLIVDKLSGDMKKWREFNVLYPVGGGIFIHVYSSERAGSGYGKYVVVEPPKPHPKVFKLVDEAIALRIGGEHVFGSDEEKRKFLLYLLDEVLLPVDEVDYEKLELKRGKVPVKREHVGYVKYHVVREKLGVGVLEPFLRDPYLEDVSLSGVGKFYVIHKMFGSLESNVGFSSEEELDAFVIRLAEKIGKPASTARPIIDATLPDGSRINIVFGSDVSLRGSNLTIRRVAKTPISVTQLIDWGTFDSRMAAYMWMMLREGMSAFICGETASGKTTTLNALAVFIRPSAKIVSIEDTAEVVLPHPNWTRELTRDTGKPESSVTMFDLLKAALRQRPNYIIVGEIRGAEGNIAFQAMQSVSWETPVAVKVGRKSLLTTIGELVEGFVGSGAGVKKAQPKDLKVLSLDRYGRLRWSSVSEVQRHPPEEVYKIVYNDGNAVCATGYHSVFTLDPRDLLAKPTLVSELEPGDFLITFKRRTNRLAEALRALSPDADFEVSEEVSDKVYKSWLRALEGNASQPRKFPLQPVLEMLEELGVELPASLRYLRSRASSGAQSFIEEPTLRRLYEELRKSRKRTNELRGALSKLKLLLDSDISVVQVEKVEPLGSSEPVYDLSVPETQLFFGGEHPVALHNTGHPVLATFHAADLDRLIQRLTNYPISVPKTHLDNLNVAWFQSAVYVRGFPARRATKVVEIIGYDPQSDAVAAMPVFVWDPSRDKFVFSGRGSSYLLEEKIAVMRGLPRSRIAEVYEELEARKRYLDLLVEKKVFEYDRVFKAVVYAEQVGLEKAIKDLEAGKEPF